MTEQTLCPKCTSPAFLKFKTKDYNRGVSDQKFSYYQCSNCPLLFLFPIPQDLESYYPPEYHYIPSSQEEVIQGAQVEYFKIGILKSVITKGRLLDIGPAWGGFPYLAKKEGFEVEAIEMDEPSCQFLNETLHIPTIQTSNITSGLAHVRPYDVITMWQVIEHLNDPWTDLKAIVKALAPKGFLIIAAPNPDSLQLKLLKSRWTHIDAPRHLSLIPSSLIIDHLKVLGCKLILKTTTDEGSLAWNEFGWEYSFSNLSSIWPFQKGKKKIKKGFMRLGRLVSKLFKPFEEKDISGSCYTLIFRKE